MPRRGHGVEGLITLLGNGWLNHTSVSTHAVLGATEERPKDEKRPDEQASRAVSWVFKLDPKIDVSDTGPGPLRLVDPWLGGELRFLDKAAGRALSKSRM
jgi:hypothetical protein